MYYLICFIIILLIIYNHNSISKKINLYDKADNIRKLHNEDVPQNGGIYIFFGLSLYLIFNLFYFNQSNIQKDLLYLYFFSLTFLIIGILDDKFNIKANIKLILFCIIIILLITLEQSLLINNVYFHYHNINFSLGNFSYFWTLLCFLLFMNAFNMFDGINLQSGFYSLSMFFYFYLFSDKFDLLNLTIIIFLAGFIYLNFKSKSFLGNNGTYFISFMLSFISINVYNSENKILVDEIVLIMIIPGLDLLRLFFSRIKRKKHPFKADRRHLHHLLQKKLNNFQTFAVLYLITWMPIILAKFFDAYLFMITLNIFLYFSIYYYFDRLVTSKK